MKTLLLILFLITNTVHAATVQSVSSGNWENGATWSTGSVPACGDIIIINAGHVVTVTTNNSTLDGCGSASYLQIYGTLDFGNGDKLNLDCGSGLAIESGGSIISTASGGGASNQITVCGGEVWRKSDGTVSGPSSLGTVVLPVELISFEASIENNIVSLSWSTASESNSSHFVVERSMDGYNWESVSIVKASGNSSTLKTYVTEDRLESAGIYFYRLVQYDLNGANDVYGPIQVQYSKLASVNPYPNPTDGIVYLNNYSDEEYTITIISINGAIVSQFQLNGTNEIDLSDLPAGMYVMSISNSTEQKSHRIQVY